MKISITGITHDDNRVKGTASVEYDYLIAPVTMCSIPVSVEYVEGKSLEQYTRELKETALGIIRAMHGELIDNSAGKTSSAWSIKLDGKGCIASRNLNINIDGVTPEKQPVSEELSENSTIKGALSAGCIDGDLNFFRAEIAPANLSEMHINRLPNFDDMEKRIAALEEKASGGIERSSIEAIYNIGNTAAKEFLSALSVQENCHCKQTKLGEVKIEVAFPVMKPPTYTSNGGLFDTVRVERIGGVVAIIVADGTVLSLEYIENYNPETTLSGYESRAKDYALSVLSVIRKAQ